MIRSHGSKMVTHSEVVNDYILEDKLVEMWPDYPCLYVVTLSDFKNRDKREQAFKEMAARLDQTVEWVKIKIRLLRNSYTKARKPQTSGSARKHLTKRSKWLLEKLQFLAPYIAARPTITNLDTPSPSDTAGSEDTIDVLDDGQSEDPNDTSSVFESEADEGESSTSTSTPKFTKQPIIRPNHLKRQRDAEEYQLIKGLAESITQRNKAQKKSVEDNAVCAFGRYVTQTLSEFDPYTRNMAQFHINNI
ncbi:uncharacterized protein LOC121652246 [Melanotaenia boesemani]|uniref:uncharacterized protein LOC121652246 n=1 Tax=Melanotaenia boesemani TaxID=1250792 RepID=UPI001C03F697|nr:uncharacterized protein LOC121652246 [Melanotaenia boesemani]